VKQEEFDRLAALGVLENHPAGKAWSSDVVPALSQEPSRIVWLSETGYPCILSRNHSGAWCGYVGIEPSHPVAQHSTKDLQGGGDNYVDLEVHGGVTFGPAVASWPQALCDADTNIYIGFDCAHSIDWTPGLAEYNSRPLLQYRDASYAREECEKLAAQLKALESADSVDSVAGLG
jgi:hypothetical protein